MNPAHLAQTVTPMHKIPLASQNQTYRRQWPSLRIRTLQKPFTRLMNNHAKYAPITGDQARMKSRCSSLAYRDRPRSRPLVAVSEFLCIPEKGMRTRDGLRCCLHAAPAIQARPPKTKRAATRCGGAQAVSRGLQR
jgi:hypothetical protein